MRVLLIAPQPSPSHRAMAAAVRRMAEGLCGDGHSVDLLGPADGLDPSFAGLTVLPDRRLATPRREPDPSRLARLVQEARLALELWRLAKPREYDVVVAVEATVYAALLLRWRHRGGVIYAMGSTLRDVIEERRWTLLPVRQITARMEAWAVRSAAVVVPICIDVAQLAASTQPGHDAAAPPRPPTGSGRDPDPLDWLGKDAPQNRCLALYVGELTADRGADLLLSAVERLPANSPVRVLAVGGSESEVDRYRSTASHRGLDSRLRFLGPVPAEQLKRLVSRADILLSPRTSGRCPRLELHSFLDSGRAILATRVPAHTQVFDDSSALLVEPDAESFALGLVRLAENADLRTVLAEAAKRRVARSHSLSSLLRRAPRLDTRTRWPSSTALDRMEVLRAADPMWGRSCRRTTRDRRSSSDRRGWARASADRRVTMRRLPTHVGAFAHGTVRFAQS